MWLVHLDVRLDDDGDVVVIGAPTTASTDPTDRTDRADRADATDPRSEA